MKFRLSVVATIAGFISFWLVVFYSAYNYSQHLSNAGIYWPSPNYSVTADESAKIEKIILKGMRQGAVPIIPDGCRVKRAWRGSAVPRYDVGQSPFAAKPEFATDLVQIEYLDKQGKVLSNTFCFLRWDAEGWPYFYSYFLDKREVPEIYR